jgi:hypothetical protein
MEEVCLLLEEMRRVLVFLKRKARIWEALATACGLAAERNTVELVGSNLLLCNREEGLRAYALYQAWIQRELHGKFKSLWRDVPSLVISCVGTDTDIALDVYNQLTKELASELSFFYSGSN